MDEFLGLLVSAISDGELMYGRGHGFSEYDLLNKVSDYRRQMSDIADEDNSYVLGVSVNTCGLRRCVAMILTEQRWS